MTDESIQLGHVTCDYLTEEAFLAEAAQWLAGSSFHHVVTLNPEMVLIAESDTRFRAAVTDADVRVPDGSGLIWARWYLRSEFWSLLPSLIAFSFRRATRVAGVDLVSKLSELAATTHQSVYLLGGTEYQNTQTQQYLKKHFPGLTIHSAPTHRFDIAGPESIITDIQAKQPAILFVAYGAPKQTVWITENKGKLAGVKMAIGVGGAFAILSEDRPRAPLFLRKRNLEWLWRLILEPSRLPRIWNAVVRFPAMVHRQKAEGK